MLSRMWTAESEKAVTAALIDEYAAAATTAMRWVIKCEAPGARGRGHKTTHKTDKVAPKLLCIYCLYYPRSSISSYRYN